MVDDALPRVFGSFTLLHLLAEGGMGELFLARASSNTGIERLCAVKTLRRRHANDAEYARRFLDEARLVVQLNHRNICGVQQVGEVDGVLFIAMDHVLGRDFARVLQRCHDRGRALAPAIALAIVREILEALDYAHRLTHAETGAPLQLVHRDLSPKNVMISLEGEVKLIDFGMAASTMKTERTAAGQVLGKLAYLAPEQVKSLPVDARADQFAAAIVAYEALTASRFYEGMSPEAVWNTVGHDYLPAGWPRVPAGIARILQRALSPDPAQRYPTCGAMRRDIEQYMVEQKMIAGPAELRDLMAELFPEAAGAFRDIVARATERTSVGRDRIATDPTLVVRDAARAPSSDTDRNDLDDGTEVIRTRTRPIASEPMPSTEPRSLPRTIALISATTLALGALAALAVIAGMKLGAAPTAVVATSAPPPPASAPLPIVVADAGDAGAIEREATVDNIADAGTDSAKPDVDKTPHVKRPQPQVPVSSMSLPQKLAALKACGARRACAADLLARGAAQKSPDETRAFLLEVDKCVTQCRR